MLNSRKSVMPRLPDLCNVGSFPDQFMADFPALSPDGKEYLGTQRYNCETISNYLIKYSCNMVMFTF